MSLSDKIHVGATNEFGEIMGVVLIDDLREAVKELRKVLENQINELPVDSILEEIFGEKLC